MMKSLNPSQIIVFLLMTLALTGCDVVVGIFEAGVWVGIIIVLLIIFLVIWLIRKFLG